jgi:hypothetical protein
MELVKLFLWVLASYFLIWLVCAAPYVVFIAWVKRTWRLKRRQHRARHRS